MSVKKIMILALTLIVISIIGNTALYAFGQSPFNMAAIEEKQTVNAQNISNVNITSNSGNIKVSSYDGQDIQIEMKGKAEQKAVNDFQLDVSKNENQLTIEAKQAEKIRFFIINSGDYELLVNLPKKVYQQIKADSEFSNISLSGIEANQSTFTSAYGDIEVNGLKGEVKAESAFGNIDFKLQNIRNDVTADSQIGNITVKTQEAPQSLQPVLKNQFGEKRISLPEGSIGSEGPLVKLSSTDGNIALLMADQ